MNEFDAYINQNNSIINTYVRYFAHQILNDVQKSTFDEIRQNVLIRIWNSFSKTNEVLNTTFISTIAKTVTIDIYRERKKTPLVFTDEFEENVFGVNETFENELDPRLKSFINKLNPEQQKIIKYYLQGYKNFEIAELMGCSEAAIKAKISRIKEISGENKPKKIELSAIQLQNVKPKNKQIIELYNSGKTLSEIGEVIGVSGERIRQIIKQIKEIYE